jgi:hypothetical protein
MHEDPDRLFKANAMLTFAQVSLHDLEPQLRAECERMAGRERQRRAERREARAKEKAAAQAIAHGNGNGTYAPGTRRSTRNNGQHLDIEITDPLLLERKLKRQRSRERSTGIPASPAKTTATRWT